MDNLQAARSLMGTSLGFHIVFTAIGIGMPLFFLIAEGIALRGGPQEYMQMARRWGRTAAVLFAIGAVSGTVLSLEFGLLWPTWSAFAGGVVGIAFALEGFAFFIEGIFLALYIYGWDRLSPLAHWLCSIPAVIGSAGSAFFVISANAWMNQPAGFTLVNGRVTSVDPWRAMFNPAMPYEVIHGLLAAYVSCGFAVAGVYAFQWLRGRRTSYTRRALTLAMAVGAVAMVAEGVAGDSIAVFDAHHEPEKFAAMEAQFQTQGNVPLRIGGIPNVSTHTTSFALEIPDVVSWRVYGRANAVIRGLDSFPQNAIPDPRMVHYPFQIMAGTGVFLLALSAWFWGAALWRRRSRPSRLLLLAIVAALPLGFLALECGWLTTEFGRQPWVVYHVMRTSAGATTAGGIVWLFGAFVAGYILLTAGLIWLLLADRLNPIRARRGRREQLA